MEEEKEEMKYEELVVDIGQRVEEDELEVEKEMEMAVERGGEEEEVDEGEIY